MSDSSSASTPTHISSGEGAHFYDPHFTAEISQKMRVPKRIKIDGESDDPVINGPSYDLWNSAPKLDMRVPERIIVLGNNEHFGTRNFSPPEMVMENASRPPDLSSIHIQSPPRVITLDKHHYPSATEFVPPPYMMEDNRPLPAPRTVLANMHADHGMEVSLPHNSSSRDLLNMSDMSHVEGLSANEEIVHLRRQLVKLNRRVIAIELDNIQRNQRDKILYALGLAYVFIKTLVWLSKSN